MGTEVGALVLLAGAILLIAAILGPLRTGRLIASAIPRDGTVVRLNAGGSHPEIAFHALDGTIIDHSWGGLIVGHRVGQAVQVLYDPVDPPGSARARSFGSLWGGSLALTVCSAGLTALGLASPAQPSKLHVKGR